MEKHYIDTVFTENTYRIIFPILTKTENTLFSVFWINKFKRLKKKDILIILTLKCKFLTCIKAHYVQ